jgi:lipopolysaccharide export system permease protein
LIIYNYLARQLFVSTAGVAFVLSLILISGRFIKYMAEAASGRILGDVLFAIMAYRLPGFLELILPLSLFLGVLLAYGQLYMSNEMTVLTACGIGERDILLRYTIFPAICLTLVVAFLSLYLAPLGSHRAEQILTEQKSRSEFETLTPGRFHSGGKIVVYARSLSQDKTRMENLFIYQSQKSKEVEGKHVESQRILTAQSGVRRMDATTGEQYLELVNGVRYEGSPGRLDYRTMAFETYRQKLEKSTEPVDIRKLKSLTTLSLWGVHRAQEQAELQWRLSMPILVLVVAIMAVPLSKVNSRQGRFLKLIPSIMLYLLYVLLLIVSQKWLETGKIGAWIGLWWVHGVFFIFALGLLLWSRYQFQWRRLWHRGH